MNIQARKLNLIEEFLRISDVSLIEKLEVLIKSEKTKHSEKQTEPMSLEEFHNVINQAKQEKVLGKVISHEELKANARLWK